MLPNALPQSLIRFAGQSRRRDWNWSDVVIVGSYVGLAAEVKVLSHASEFWANQAVAYIAALTSKLRREPVRALTPAGSGLVFSPRAQSTFRHNPTFGFYESSWFKLSNRARLSWQVNTNSYDAGFVLTRTPGATIVSLGNVPPNGASGATQLEPGLYQLYVEPYAGSGSAPPGDWTIKVTS